MYGYFTLCFMILSKFVLEFELSWNKELQVREVIFVFLYNFRIDYLDVKVMWTQ